MKRGILCLVLALMMASPVMAADRCYSPAEAQAEQLLRLHSELMVITVTCRQSSTGQSLVPAYTDFTKRNIDALHEAEATMTRYYKAAYGGNGTTKLDRLRTLLANEFGQQIAAQSAPAFCTQRRDKVVALNSAAPDAVLGAATQIAAQSYEPMCRDIVKTARKN